METQSRRVTAVATLLIVAAVSTAWAGNANAALQAAATRRNLAPGVPVVTAQVGSSAVPTVLNTLGMVDSLGKTTLTAPVTGEIDGPFHTAGEVAAGAVVARNVPAALQGQLVNARAQLEYARTALHMTQQLAGQHLKTALDVAQARRNLVGAESQLANLQTEAGQQELRSPFAGTLHYLVAPGTVVYRGTPIATISGRAEPWIDVRVPPGTAHSIEVGEPALITGPTWHGQGRVVAVGQDARPWGLARIRISLPRGIPLIPGEWTHVRLMRGGAPAPVVPRAAVVMRGAKAMVFVILRHQAHVVSVRVLAEAQRRIWVQGALQPGEKVAVVGVTRLADGSPVIPGTLASAH